MGWSESLCLSCRRNAATPWTFALCVPQSSQESQPTGCVQLWERLITRAWLSGAGGAGQESPGLPSANWRPRTPVGTSPSLLKAGRGQGRCTLRLQQKADSSFPASLSCPGLGGLGDATHPPRRGPRALIWPPAQGVSSGNTHRHSWALFACCLGIPWPGRVDTKNNHPRCVTREASMQVPVPNSPVCCGLLSCAHGLRPHSVSKGFSGVGPPSQRFIFASGGGRP